MEKVYRQVLTQKDVEMKQSFMECVAEVFSLVMEEKVTPQQASCILNVFASLLLVVFPVNIPFIFRVVFMVWMGVSVCALRKCDPSANDDL